MLPEDADLTVDPEHSENLISPTTSSPDTSSAHFDTLSSTTPVESMTTSSEKSLSAEPEPLQAPSSEVISEAVFISTAEVKVQKESNPAATPKGSEVQPVQQAVGEGKAPKETKRSSEADKKGSGAPADFRYATLSRVRKFKVDGEVIQSVTKKIMDVTENKTLRDSKKYQQMRFVCSHM